MDTAEAYRACEEITWSQARNFAYGIRLLPVGKRQALAALYAFARRIDDIGDGTMPPAAKLAALEEARAEVLGMTRPGGVPDVPSDPAAAEDDPVLVALADTGKQFAVPMQAFGELIDGCAADVNGTFYGTFGDLLHYCRCVAGSIGRLSLGVFGAPDMAVTVTSSARSTSRTGLTKRRMNTKLSCASSRESPRPMSTLDWCITRRQSSICRPMLWRRPQS